MTNISFLLSSRSPSGQLDSMLQSMHDMAKNPQQIEVLVKIDRDDLVSTEYYESKKWQQYGMNTKFIITDQGKGWFAIGSQVWNQLLFCSNPESYYIMFGKDDLRFKLKHWDEKLLSYRGRWADDIFYIRTSEFKRETYGNDLYNMITKPDNYSVYTRKLMHLLEGVGDYWAQDSWLQPILSTLELEHNIHRAIILEEDLYDWESMKPCAKQEPQASEIQMAFYRLMQPLYVKYTYRRIASNIRDYISTPLMP